MARSWGSIAAGGLLGAVAGGAKAAYDYSVEEEKREAERIREERLAKLRLQEYQAKADIDLSVMPKKAAIETQAAVERQTALTPGLLERKRSEAAIDLETFDKRDRQKRDTDLEYAPMEAEAKAKEVAMVDAARLPHQIAIINAQGDKQMRVAEVAAKVAAERNWHPSADGTYYDATGKQVMTRVRVEGRGWEEVPIRVPESKIKTKPEVYSVEDQVKQIDKEILQALRERDEEGARRLKLEKQRLLTGKDKPATVTSPQDYIDSILKPKPQAY